MNLKERSPSGATARKKNLGLGGDGLHDTFTGIFIRRSSGDTYVNCLHRYEPKGEILREQLVVRSKQGEAEHYVRDNDAPIGRGSIQDSSHVNAFRSGCLGFIFPADQIKRLMGTKGIECSIGDESAGGTLLKVLTFSFKGTNRVWQRFWIDLRRGGHTVRYEDYAAGNILVSRVDIKLDSFKVNGKEVWMPVSAVAEGHSELKDGKPYYPKEPTSTEIIYINAGTIVFNTRPGAETFKISYKPGTPISDSLRKLEYEFGRQKVGPTVSKLEAEAMLKEQIAKAEAQKAELSVASSADSTDWSPWAACCFGMLALGSSLVLLIQRRKS